MARLSQRMPAANILPHAPSFWCHFTPASRSINVLMMAVAVVLHTDPSAQHHQPRRAPHGHSQKGPRLPLLPFPASPASLVSSASFEPHKNRDDRHGPLRSRIRAAVIARASTPPSFARISVGVFNPDPRIPNRARIRRPLRISRLFIVYPLECLSWGCYRAYF